jgi:uncharacterized protein DUF4314
MQTRTPLPAWLKEGARFQLVRMDDDPDPIPAGATGTITYVNDLNFIGDHDVQLWVDWDPLPDGRKRTLMLCWPHDQIIPLED